MRIIKFRFFDKLQCKYINDPVEIEIIRLAISKPIKDRYIGFTKMDHKRFKIEQFSGIYDNTQWNDLTKKEKKIWKKQGKYKETWNGKEIFEGDICEVRRTIKLFENYTVVYNNDTCTFVFKNDSNDLFQYFYSRCIRIVGNVNEKNS